MKSPSPDIFSIRGFAILLAIAANAVPLAPLLPLLQLAENLGYDLRMTYLAERVPASERILLVGITEETLATLPYRSPVDRRFLADVLEALVDKGASVIGIDLLFDQPTEAAKDREPRRVLESAPIPVVVASAGLDNHLLPRQVEFLERYTDDLRRGNATVFRHSLDGVVREFPLRVERGGAIENGLAAEVALAAGAELPGGQRQWIDGRRVLVPGVGALFATCLLAALTARLVAAGGRRIRVQGGAILLLLAGPCGPSAPPCSRAAAG